MAVYQFSNQPNGQAIAFNPNTDVLNFEWTGHWAANVRLTVEGANLRVAALWDPHEVVLLNTSPLQLTTANITFANGSRLLAGDNTTGTAGDNNANSLVGTEESDFLIGFGGNDTLNGGLGHDYYVVGTGDVLIDAGGIETVESAVSWTLGAGFENLTFTGTATISGTGNNLANTIRGNSAGNWLRGLEGDDFLYGFGGNDVFNMSNGPGASYGSDRIDGGDGVDTLDYGAAARTAVVIDLAGGTATGGGTAGAGSATLISIENANGSAFADRMTGSAAANFLYGFDGNDTLDGGAGNDRLEGAGGNDQYLFSVAPGAANADTITGFASGADKIVLDGNVHLNLGASGNFSAGDARFAAGAGFTSGRDASDRVIYNTTTGQLFYDADGNGAGSAQLVATLQGAPTMSATDILAVGSGGASTTGTAGNDSLTGTAGDDTIDGLGGNDTLRGMAGDDSLLGGGGDDIVDGGEGNDTMDGGAGADHYFVNDGDVVSDSGAAGPIDTVHSFAVSWEMDATTEALVLETGAISGDGNDFDNRLDGSARTNNIQLYGWGGHDTVLGGAGNDDLDGGWDTDLIVGGAGDDVLNQMYFGDGDTLDGGLGNDTYYIGWNNVLLDDPGGIDTVVTSNSWTLGAGYDNLTFVNYWDDNGIHGLEGYGNELDNVINGFGGDGVVFDGRAGNDTLYGTWYSDLFLLSAAPGSANADEIWGWDDFDTLRLDPNAMTALGAPGRFQAGDARFAAGAGFTSGQDSSDRVVYNTTTGNLYYDADGSGAGTAQLIAHLNEVPALAATNIEVGSGSGGQAINGTAGNDSIVGTKSDDTINGFAGNDTLHGGGGGDSINGGAGNDLLVSDRDHVFDYPEGEEGDTLIGGDGDDTLDGWGNGGMVVWYYAPDRLDGGLGNDVYYVDGDDTLIDAGGTDTVIVNFGWYTLGSGFENLSLSSGEGGGGLGIGNELNNVMSSDQRSQLEGRGGNDTMSAGFESALFGEAGDDLLQGDVGTMDGGTGNDTLRGFSSEMTGGAGADRFGIHDSVITDFSSGADTLELDGELFAGVGPSGRFSTSDARFHSGAGVNAAHDATDRVIYNSSSGELWYDVDGTGSQSARFIARLEGSPTLLATDIDVVNGTTGGVVINGTAGSDSLTGTEGNDTINGLGGNDTLAGLAGEDSLVGGDGNDSLDGGDGVDQLDGGAGNDTFIATQGDSLVDAAGVDQVVTDASSWTLAAGFENLTTTAFYTDGDGNTAANLMRLTQHGRFWGREGNDTLIGGTGTSEFYGNEGDDLLQAGDGGGNYFPGSGNDTVVGGAGGDRINVMYQVSGGNYGTDSVSGGGGSDWLEFDDDALSGITVDLSAGLVTGGGVSGSGMVQLSGVENVQGSNFADRITGDASANWLYGDFGSDTLNGGAGNDTLTGGEDVAADIFAFSHFGGANADIVDRLISGSDKIALDANAFTAIGASGDFAAGDARFVSGAGVNSGQDSTDRVAYNTTTGELWYDADGSSIGAAQLIATLALRPSLAATDIQVFGATPPPTGGQTINGTTGNDTVTGGAGNDTINGLAGNDLLQGLGGNDSVVGATGWDTLQGGDGDDRLYAGGWSDTMTGGAGADSFVWAEAGTGNRDTVTDFASGTDELLFENGTLTAMGAAGAWSAGDARFWAAAGATSGHDGDDRLIYNTTTGNLYYDADGSGAGAAQVVATFTGAPGITATDITVI